MKRPSSLPFAVLFACAATIPAQCNPQWQPGAAPSGPAGYVYAVAQLPNGDVVAAGQFPLADTTVVSNVARFDGTTWHPLGGGVNGIVYAAVTMPNGDVVVAGSFTQAGGAPANRIARWNGSSWSPLGGGLANRVNCLCVLGNGDLVAGGDFVDAGGVATSRIARWDGTAWSALGSGLNNSAQCLAVRANGDLIAGGAFFTAGGVATRALATWNGSAWSAVPGLDHYSSVFDVVPLANGDFAVVGTITIGIDLYQFGIANGTSVQPVTPPPGLWRRGVRRANGDLVLAGYVPGALGVPSTGVVASWNGTTWTQFGNGAPADCYAIRIANNGDVIVGGRPNGLGVTAANVIARHDGTQWTTLGGPRPPKVNAFARLANGDVMLGGEFTSLRGVAANNVALWRNGAVIPLGLGVDGPVRSITTAPDGSAIVCGSFTLAGGGPANRIARWTGTAWATIGNGLSFAADTVAAAGGGQVLAKNFVSSSQAPTFHYFDGSSWSQLVLPQYHNLMTFAAAPEGDFILGGLFPQFGGNTGTLRFDHGVTSFTGVQPWMVDVMGNDAQGRVLAKALKLGALEVLRLEGNAWTSTADLPVVGGTVGMQLTSLPNGDPLVAMAPYTNGGALLRFDGAAWSVLQDAIDIGQGSPLYLAPVSMRTVVTDAGEVLLGSDVRGVAGVQSTGFAVAQPGCPAAAVAFGTGCSGGGGVLTLAADNRPWIGGAFRSTAAGFTPGALGLHAIGTQQVAVPLPFGAPGCSLFTTPDVLAVLLPANGSAPASFDVPRDVALAGLQLRTQVVDVEFDALGSLHLASTNALQLTLGAL